MALPLVLGALGALGKAGGAALKLGIGAGQNTHRSGSFGETKFYDPNASNYGGQPGGRAAYVQQMDQRRQQIEGREAFQANYGQANVDRARGIQARNAQGAMANQMTRRAQGLVPSIAQMQADRQMQQATAAQASAAASARGPAALALAQQTAAANTANVQSAISNGAQINAANEKLAAEQAAFGAHGNLRQGDLASQQQSASQAQFQTQMQQANRDGNDTRAMGYEGLAARANEAELQAKMQQQGQLAASHGQAEGYNAQRHQQNANREGKLWDDFIPSDASAKIPMMLSDMTGKLGLGGPSGVGGGVDMGSKGSISGEDVQQGSTGLASGVPMSGMVGGGGITGGNMGSLGMPQGGGMSSGGFLGFLSDTTAKRAALLAEGRRQGMQMAGKGPDRADVDFIRRGYDEKARPTDEMLDARFAEASRGRGAAEDGIGRQALDDALGQQVQQDRADLAIDKQLETQREQDNRIEAQKIREGFAADERKAARTPWWMTPVDDKAFAFLSDERAKRAAFEDGARYATRQITGEEMAPWSPDDEGDIDEPDDPLKGYVAPPGPSPLPDPPPAGSRSPVAFQRDKRAEPQDGDADRFRAAGQKRLAEKNQTGTGPVVLDASRFLKKGRDPVTFERGNPIAEANRSLAGSPYAYKPGLTPPSQTPGEVNFGPMAQNLEKSPVAATAVKEDPTTGLKMLDRDKLLKVVASGVADLQRQQDQTRASMQKLRLSSGGRKRR